MSFFAKFNVLVETISEALSKADDGPKRKIVGRAAGASAPGEQFKPGQTVDEGYRAPAPSNQSKYDSAMRGSAPEAKSLLFGVSHQKFRPRQTTKEGETKFEPSESVIHILHDDGKSFGHALLSHHPEHGAHVDHLMLNDEKVKPEYRQFVHDMVKKHLKEYTKSPEFKQHTKDYHDKIQADYANAPNMEQRRQLDEGDMANRTTANAAPGVKGDRAQREKPGQARPNPAPKSDGSRKEEAMRAGLDRQKAVREMNRQAQDKHAGTKVEGSEKKKI